MQIVNKNTVNTYITGFIVIIVIIYLIYGTLHFTWHHDGSIAPYIASRLIKGDILYTDVFTFWMPGSFTLLTTIYSVFGQSLIALRVCIFCIMLGISVLVFCIGRSLTTSSLGGAVGLALFSLPSVLPMYNHNLLGLLFASLTIFLLINGERRNDPYLWFFAGILTGITTTSIQWQGVALAITCFILLLQQKESKKEPFLAYTLGGLIVTAGLIFYIIVFNNPSRAFYQLVIFPLTSYYKGNFHIPSQIWWSTTFFYLIFYYTAYKEHLLRNWRLKATALAGTIFHITSLTSPTSGHTALNYAFTAPVAVYFTQKIHHLFVHPNVFPAPSFKALFVNTTFLRYTVKRIVFLMVLFAFIGKSVVNFTAKMGYVLTQETFRIQTSEGVLYTDKIWKDWVNTLRTFLSKQDIGQKREVFIAPWAPELYNILELTNSTSHAHLGPEHYFSPEIVVPLVKTLKDKNTAIIIFLPSASPMLYTEHNALTRYIETNFTNVLPLPSLKPDEQLILEDGVWVMKSRDH